MARKKKKRLFLIQQVPSSLVLVLFVAATTLVLGGLSLYKSVKADAPPLSAAAIDPNIGLRAMTEEFFTANDAKEMLPIIKCESQFRHYDTNGSVLQNNEGSSAIGVAQILASKHPDPKLVRKYNRVHNTALSTDDFDITTPAGNLAYALLLYELRGTRDWECAKRFRFGG